MQQKLCYGQLQKLTVIKGGNSLIYLTCATGNTTVRPVLELPVVPVLLVSIVIIPYSVSEGDIGVVSIVHGVDL